MKKVSEAIWTEILAYSPVFSTAQVAESARVTVSNASRDLATLEKARIVTRVRRGLWAVPQHPDFSPYAVVPHLFGKREVAYVSLLTALSLHGVIEQIPRVIQVVTHSKRPTLRTPVGTDEFHLLQSRLFGGYQPYNRTRSFDLATPEKALFDTLYLSTRKDRRFTHLPEIELPDDFSGELVEAWGSKIDHTVLRTAVAKRWNTLAERGVLGRTI